MTCSPSNRSSADIWVALGWCIGLLVVAYALAMATYHRKMA